MIMRDEEKCPYLSMEEDMGKTIPICGKAGGKICDNCENERAKKSLLSALMLGSFAAEILGGDDNATD